MGYVKRIVCLANSYKPPQGRCIAGIEVLGRAHGGWIRPVSERESRELSYSEYRYQNGEIPRLLDIIDVPLLSASPHNPQTENHIIDPKAWWSKKGELDLDDLEELCERPESIWINSDHTQAGTNDCISAAEGAALESSLLLIKRKEFRVEVGTSRWSGKRTYRGGFTYKGTPYSLSLTDPAPLSVYSAKEEGEYPLKDVYLCLSLTEPFEKDGRCHKLVAAVIKGPPL